MPGSNDKISQVAAELAASFVKNYKYSLQDANDFFYNSIAGNKEIQSIIAASASDKQLSKNAVFKNFVKQLKKELYYRLRQYKGNASSKEALLDALTAAAQDPSKTLQSELLESLASFHVSSQERFHENDLFYDQLAPFAENASSIADIGCGVQPLFFPHARFSQVKKYLALDKDKESLNLVQAFRNTFPDKYEWLFPQVWNISEGWRTVGEEHSSERFDLALMLKLVPVVKRTNPELLVQLAAVPAETIIISGVKESMVKKQDIERKERRAIDHFIKETGRTRTGEFELGNEFFIIIS